MKCHLTQHLCDLFLLSRDSSVGPLSWEALELGGSSAFVDIPWFLISCSCLAHFYLGSFGPKLNTSVKARGQPQVSSSGSVPSLF